MPRTAYRKIEVIQTVYTLCRTVNGQTATCGQFSTVEKAQAEAARIVRATCRVANRIGLRLSWEDGTLNYGRDGHDFRFSIEPWPVDSEGD